MIRATIGARRALRKVLKKSNPTLNPSLADVMTALIQIQDNQTEIMNAIQNLQFNQCLAIEFQGEVGQQLAGLGSPVASQIDGLINQTLGQLAPN
jgi:hypothetical protein